MIKKMTKRALDAETTKFKERTAHDQCTSVCRISCKMSNPPDPEANQYGTYWFPE